MTEQILMFIDGKDHVPCSEEFFDTTDPSTGAVIAAVAKGDADDVDIAVNSAANASEEWASLSPLQRGRILIRVGQAILDNRDRLAQMESLDMGMPTKASPGVIESSAEFFEYYGGLAPSILGDTIPGDDGKFVYTRHEPYGVVGVITPWNAPLNQACRSVAPALAAGNTVVLKPSEHSNLTTVEFARLAVEAGLPPGVLNVVTGFGAEVGTPLVMHPKVNKVGFTGSARTGQVIGVLAAEKVMPVTLELGGKSPNIVFEDANLEAALPMVLFGFIANSGQICSSGTRVLVQRSIYEKFSHMLAAAAEQIPIGIDNEFPTLGPIANQMQYNKVMEYFESAQEEGATVLTGGEKATGEGLDQGLYIKPTIFTDVKPGMRIVREEIFGPAGVLIPFDTEEEAIEIANDTDYGLCSAIWSQNASRVHRVAAKIKAGTVYINTYHDQSVGAPAGGYKKSGIGRERGVQALKQYTQVKSVTMHLI